MLYAHFNIIASVYVFIFILGFTLSNGGHKVQFKRVLKQLIALHFQNKPYIQSISCLSNYNETIHKRSSWVGVGEGRGFKRVITPLNFENPHFNHLK